MPFSSLLRAITGRATPAAATALRVTISAPKADAHSPVSIRYALVDPSSRKHALDVAYSTDGGHTFKRATEATGVGSNGRAGLASSPAGVQHLFAWAALHDLHQLPSPKVLVRLTASVGQAKASATTVGFKVVPAAAPAKPQVKLAPLAGPLAAPVALRYTAIDAASKPLALAVEFSRDGGATFAAASEALNAGSEGKAGLASSPAGVAHLYAWDAAADLAPGASTSVVLRVTASDGQQRASASTPPVVVAAVQPPTRPRVLGFTPESSIGPVVPLRFVLSQAESRPVSIDVEYTSGTGSYAKALPALGSDRTDDLPAPSVGAAYRFLWDASSLGQASAVQVRITPRVGGVAGTPFVSSAFAVDASDPHRPPPYTPPQKHAPKLEKAGGDAQTVVSGRSTAQPLRVRVTANGSPVAAARVDFSLVEAPGSPPGLIERDPDDWTTTDEDGYAGVRVRFTAGRTGKATVKAQLVGVADAAAAATFSLEAVAPRILHLNPPAADLPYGVPHTMQIGYDGDGDTATDEFAALPIEQVELSVSAVNGLVSCRTLRLTSSFGTLDVVPTTFDDDVQVTVADPLNGVTETFTLPVRTQPNAARRTAPQGTGQYTPMRIKLAVTGGLVGGAPQVGYGGLTLAAPLVLQLVDEQGHAYSQWDAQYATGCVPPQGRTLSVVYDATAGTLWTDKGPRTDGSIYPGTLVADLGKPVYFTPAGQGPWSIRAALTQAPLDPSPNEWSGVDANGNPWCIRDNSLSTYGGDWAQVTIPVQTCDLQAIDDVSGDPIGEVRVGDRIRIHLGGLSPTAGGTAEPLRVESLTFGGQAPRTYNYAGAQPASFDQRVPLQAPAAGSIDTRPFLVVPGTPVTVPAGTLAQSACYDGWLRLGVAQGLPLSVEGRRPRRKRSGATEALQESPAGNTPAAGAAGTVSLASGELVYRTVDLELECRHGPLQWGRTYRSLLSAAGPLGPGWTLDHGDFLDLGDDWRFRWLQGSGRYDDCGWFASGTFPPGSFYDLQWSFDVDDDTSPFLVLDPHRNELHFNADGSLRFVRDHVGNKTRYDYDAAGRLVTIADVHGRTTQLEYWQHGDPVDDAIFGLLRRVTDPAGRFVEYEYYEPTDAGGPTGFLKKVYLPAAPTLVGGGIDASYRRTETYVYETTTADPLDAKLLKVLDDDGSTWLESRYDDDGRVHEQDFGKDDGGRPKTFTFDYAASPPTTTVTDRAGGVVVYAFAESALADAATPVTVTEQLSSGDRTWTLVHDDDGRRVHVETPTGQQASFVYDDGPARSRGNLLALRVGAAGAGERVWTWEYGGSGDFNYVSRFCPPAGNLLGACSSVYATTYWYGPRGELLQVWPPRAQQLTMLRDPTYGLVERWIDDRPIWARAYNAAGLLRRSIDPHGVVTEYSYYSEQDPIGATSQPSPDGGGLLAAVEHDVAGGVDGNPANPRRELYLPSATNPLEPLKTSLA
jgi:YD repeat-containing protein